MANASHDESSVPTLLGVSSTDNKTPETVTVTNNKLDVNASVDTTGLALDTTITDGSQKTQIVDGSGNVIGATSNALDVNIKSGGAGDGAILDGVSSAIKATVKDLTNSNPLTTAIVDGNGDQITSFGGGVQYTEGDTDTTITGTAALVEGAANALAVLTQPLTDTQLRATAVPISGSVTADLGANNDVTVTGTVDLGATDNAVLDTIAAKDFATQTTLAAINTKLVTGTDIGDVTINNAGGAAAVNIQDGGNVITVDGAVTTSGTVTATLNAETTKVIGTVNQGTSPWVTSNATTSVVGNGAAATAQRVTLANDSTGIVALTTSSAAIGKLAANSGVDIGDVDILSIAAGSNIIGKVGHDITGIGHGVKVVTTAGTDVALAASTACKKVDIQAQTDNTSLVAIGGSGVDATIATGTGIVLYPGETYSFEIDNLADVYVDALVNGEGVRFTYYT